MALTTHLRQISRSMVRRLYFQVYKVTVLTHEENVSLHNVTGTCDMTQEAFHIYFRFVWLILVSFKNVRFICIGKLMSKGKIIV